MYRQGLLASVTTERGEPCYYAKAVAPPRGCLQRSNVDMVMVGRRATPKWRRVCEACWAWLLQERLANVALPYVIVLLSDLARVRLFSCIAPGVASYHDCVLPRTQCAK